MLCLFTQLPSDACKSAIERDVQSVNKFQQNNRNIEREYNTVHLVCGESPAGYLRVGLGRENKVIGFPDFFAVGPIKELPEKVGRKRRYEWLRDHLNYPNDFIEKEYEKRFSKTLAEIDAIPDHVPIVIWIQPVLI